MGVLCLANLVSLFDMIFGFVTLLMSLPALFNISNLESGSTAVAWYGAISISCVASACLWSGYKLMVDLSKFRTNSAFYVWKFWFYTAVEVLGFLAPYIFVKDYQAQVEAFIELSWKFCSFHLLLVNPLTIGLFVYQFVSFWIVHLHIKSVNRANRAAANLVRRRNLASTATTATTTAPTQPQAASSRAPGQPGVSTSTVRIENETENRPPTPAQLNSHRQTRTTTKATTAKTKKGKIGGHHATKISAPNPSSGPAAPTRLYPNLEQLVSDDSISSSSAAAAFSACNGNSVKFNFAKAKSEPNRKFEELKSKCLYNQRLFEDPDFPANDRSLKIRNARFEWLRPHEISDNAQFFCDGASRFDVKQGKLGNCWFLAAVDNLTLNEELFEQVVPADNSWDDEDDDYAGICHFRFWSSGVWKDVVIDDRLPTQGGKLVFMQSSEKNEFWSSLLEKAFAKLTGSYGDLNGGYMSTAMKHLTGGSTEEIRLRGRNPNGLFVQMENALEEGCLLGCAIFVRCGQNESNGLVGGHAYSITGVQRVTRQGTFKNVANEDVGLIRIRNPWGNEVEWFGEWSDGHHLWTQVDKKTRQQLQLVLKDDGEFWFPITKFGKYFDLLTICYLPTTTCTN